MKLLIKIMWLGFRGFAINFIPASSGVRLPFLLLQEMQAVTRFSQVSVPPLDLGITWSTVKFPEVVPQY